MEYKNFAELVDQARAVNLAVRQSPLARVRAPHGPISYAFEFGTVRLNVGRAVGKSRYIVENAEPWDMIVCHNSNMVDNIERNFKVKPQARVLTVGRALVSNAWRGRGLESYPRTVWIDEASRFSAREIDEIYHTLACHPAQTFIMLG